MNGVKTMMWKDMRYIFRKKLLLYMIGVVVWMVVINAATFTKGKSPNLGAIFNLLFLSSTAIIFILGVTFISGVIFRNERNDFTLPSLLAGPLNIKDIFFAKFIITFVITYIFTIAFLVFFIIFILYEKTNLPSAQTILTSVITIPIWGFAIIEIIGLLYLIIGKIQYVQMITMLLIIFSSMEFLQHPLNLSHFPFLLTFAGIIIAAFLYFLISKIDKERVMRTLS